MTYEILLGQTWDRRNSRWHKIFPHKILAEYDISFYIDGNVNIINSEIFDYLENHLVDNQSETLAINRHFARNCIYHEADVCKFIQIDIVDVIKSQILIYRNLNYPESNGLVDSSMVFMRHHDEKVCQLMEDWWWWVSHYSKRDQISFNFVVWNRNFRVHIFEEIFSHNPKYVDSLSHRRECY